MKIGFDLDGVVVNYAKGLKDYHHTLIKEDDPLTYSMIEPGWFTSKQDWLNTHIRAMEHCDTFEIEDETVQEAVQRLKAAGHTVIAATARNSCHRDKTLAQLENNGIYFDELIMTGHAIPKSEIGLDWLLEDHPDTVCERSCTQMVIKDHAYNREVPENIPRVTTCLEYADLILNS